MKKIINRYSFILIVVVMIIFIFGTIFFIDKKVIEICNSTAVNLSNKKIGWGIKRNEENKQPDFGEKNKKILENNNGICVGNSEMKNIYLTFDEGYEAGYTEKILDVLKNKNVKATFFITAHYLNTQPELVKRMIDEGHIVGNHTVNHKSMPSLSDEEIYSEVMDLHRVINEKFQYEMKYFRPPMGEFSEKTLSLTNSLGYKTVMWSFAYEDWNEDKQPNEEFAKKMILDNLHNGEIILLHGNSKTNTNILEDIINEINNWGYCFKSLDEFE